MLSESVMRTSNRVASDRARVCSEAASWIGTKYHHAGMIKGLHGGVDCATLLVCVYSRVGIIPAIQVPEYPRDWHMHRKSERYMNLIMDYAEQIPQSEAKKGDVVMYKFGQAFSHGGIIGELGWPEIIHAYFGARRVERARGDQGLLAGKEMKFFSPWPARLVI